MRIMFFILINVVTLLAQDLLPLQIGNKWIYTDVNGEYNVVTIDTTQIIDGKKYYNCSQAKYVGNRFFRYRDDGYYYFRSLNDTTTWVYYKKNAQLGDIWYYYQIHDIPDFTPYAEITDTTRAVIFGKEVILKVMYDNRGLVAYTKYWTEEFGLLTNTLEPFDDVIYRLQGCIINGVVYGDTSVVTGIKETDLSVNSDYILYQNYPNPFNPTTNISYDLSRSSDVNISVYDITGSLIKTILNKEQDPGKHSVIFNASELSSGTYFFRLTFDKNSVTKKMQLIK